MSFIAFDMAAATMARSATNQPETAAVETFSMLEWSVIQASDADNRSTLDEPGRILRAFHGLLGVSRKTRLANPRLEILRRMSVLLRSRDPVTTDDESAFRAAGFTDRQLDLLKARRTRAR